MKKVMRLYESYGWVGEIASKTIIELQKTADILEEVHNKFFNEFGISSTKFNLLVILYNGPQKGMILSDIGEQMLVTKANITGLIDRLEKQGYVRRQRHQQDRRKVMACITEKGSQFTEQVIDEYRGWSKDVMTILDDDQKNLLIQLLREMQDGIIHSDLV